MIPCHRPSQNPATSPPASGLPTAGFAPAAQADSTIASTTTAQAARRMVRRVRSSVVPDRMARTVAALPAP